MVEELRASHTHPLENTTSLAKRRIGVLSIECCSDMQLLNSASPASQPQRSEPRVHSENPRRPFAQRVDEDELFLGAQAGARSVIGAPAGIWLVPLPFVQPLSNAAATPGLALLLQTSAEVMVALVLGINNRCAGGLEPRTGSAFVFQIKMGLIQRPSGFILEEKTPADRF